MKNTKKWLNIIVLAVLCMGLSVAVQGFNYVGKTYAGAQCSATRADFSILPSATLNIETELKCLGSEIEACVFVFYDYQGNSIAEMPVLVGQSVTVPWNAFHYERYNCYVGTAVCGDWVNQDCGGHLDNLICDEHEILQTRDCERSIMYGGGYKEGQCLPTLQCSSTQPECTFSASSWSACVNGIQSRTITYSNCETEKDYQSCSSNCQNPTGTAGTSYCGSNNIGYTCNGNTGKWVATGSCGDGEGDGDGDDDPDPLYEPKLTATSAGAIYDENLKAVITRVAIKNTGGDMTDTYIIEMQVRPSSEATTLSFVSDQKVCDPKHLENVHKQFMLLKGEEEIIDLQVPYKDFPKGDSWDIFIGTRHKCYNALTATEIAQGDSFQIVGPYESYKKIATVGQEPSMLVPVIAGVLALGGIAAVVYGLLPIGIPAFVIGAGMLVWHFIL